MKGANEYLWGSPPTLPYGKVQNSLLRLSAAGKENVTFEVGTVIDF